MLHGMVANSILCDIFLNLEYVFIMSNILPSNHVDRSWWILFILRQVFVLSCVKTGELIAIDIHALRTPLFFNTFGWFTTLK